jgi:hypothetical protein
MNSGWIVNECLFRFQQMRSFHNWNYKDASKDKNLACLIGKLSY